MGRTLDKDLNMIHERENMERRSTKREVVITPRKRLFDLQLNKIVEYRSLIYMLVKRDFITYYKQTILGPLWYLVQPICSTIMLIFVFGNLANIGTDNIPQPIFYFSGVILWTYFVSNLNKASNVFFTNKTLFGKVYFPRIAVPIADVISNTITLITQFVLFFLVYFYYLINGNIELPKFHIILLIPIIIWISVLAVGLGMVISSITTKYRDLAMALNFLISLIMYATPVAYPISEVHGKMSIVLCLNPMSAPIELFRFAFFGISSIPQWAIIYSLVVSSLSLFIGMIVFSQNERTFIDVI